MKEGVWAQVCWRHSVAGNRPHITLLSLPLPLPLPLLLLRLTVLFCSLMEPWRLINID